LFNKNDKPLPEKLSIVLKVGRLIDKSKQGHVLLQILAKDEVLKIIHLINGKMRTPKVEALHRAVSYINKIDKINIPLLSLYFSPLNSNVLLAGISDAYPNFPILV
jgi:hypothetical protein